MSPTSRIPVHCCSAAPPWACACIVLAAMAAGLMVADHRQHHLAAIRDGVATARVSDPVGRAGAGRRPATRCASRSRPRPASRPRTSSSPPTTWCCALKLLRFESLEQENQRLRAAARELAARRAAHAGRRDRARRPRSVPPARADQQGHARGRVPRPGGDRRERHLRPGHARRPVLGRDHPDLRPGARDPGAGQPHRRAQHRARHRALGPAVAALPAAEHRRRSSATCSSAPASAASIRPGYPVGKVTAVVRDPGQPLLAVEAEPLAGLDRDPEVLLVWFDNVSSSRTEPAAKRARRPLGARAAPAQAPARRPHGTRTPRRAGTRPTPAPTPEATAGTPPHR